MDRAEKVRLKTGWSKLDKRQGQLEGSTTCASGSLPLKPPGLPVIRKKLRDYLVKKYAVSSKLYYLRVIDTLVSGARDSGVIRLKYDADVSTSTKTLKRYYKVEESVSRIEQMSEYFKYHYEIPRLFLPRVVDVIDSFHDRKRNKIYQQVKRLIGKENIVGDDSEHEQSSLDQQAKHEGGYGFIFAGDELQRLRDGLNTSRELDAWNDTLKNLLVKLGKKVGKTSKNPRTPSFSELSMSAFSSMQNHQMEDFRNFISIGPKQSNESPKRMVPKPKIQISHRLADKLSEITHGGSVQMQIPKPTLKVNISPRTVHMSSVQESSIKSPTRFYKQTKPSLLTGESSTMFGKSRISQPSIADHLSSNKELKLQTNPSRRSQVSLMTSATPNLVQIGQKKTSAEWLNKGWFKTLGNEHRQPKSPGKIHSAALTGGLPHQSNVEQFKKEIEEFHMLHNGVRDSKNSNPMLASSFKGLRGLSTIQTSTKSFSPTINVVRSARLGKESFNLLNIEPSTQKPPSQTVQSRRFKTQGSQGYIKEGTYQIDGMFSPKASREPIQALVKTRTFDSRINGFTNQRIHNLQKQIKTGSVIEQQGSPMMRFEQRARVSMSNVMSTQSPRDLMMVRRMKSEDKPASVMLTGQEPVMSAGRVLQASILSSSGQPNTTSSGMKISTSPNRKPSFTLTQLTSTVKAAPGEMTLQLKSTSHRQSSSTSKAGLSGQGQPGHMSHKSNASRVGQQSYKSPANQLLSLLPQSAVGRGKLLSVVKIKNF